MSPRDRSPVRTLSPRQPSGKDHWNQWSPYNLTLLKLEQTTGSSGQRRTAPRLSLVSPKAFSPFCHRWSFGSLPLSPLADVDIILLLPPPCREDTVCFVAKVLCLKLPNEYTTKNQWLSNIYNTASEQYQANIQVCAAHFTEYYFLNLAGE